MKEGIVFLGIRISVEAREKIRKIAKKNLRSIAKEIEFMILSVKDD